MTPEAADALVGSSAAYVHIPFCSSICPYCDFAVVAGREDEANRYVDAVVAEVRRSESWRPLEAVYFGGGTPSHIDPTLLGRILDVLVDKHGIAADAEITLEANPEDFDLTRASHIAVLGFNRVSFGAQSFDSGVLVSLGRRHVASQISQSVDSAREAGFENISIDLIYGTPGETSQVWETSVTNTQDLMVDHVSCYALTVEPGTELGRAVRDGAAAPNPDIQADRFETAERIIGQTRYEVSNWSSEGRECRYNMTVWAQGEYEAYGNGAHGHRSGKRFRNARRLDTYLRHIEDGSSPQVGVDEVVGWDRELERLFVGLRRVVGVAVGQGTDSLLASDEGRRFIEAGVIAIEDERLHVLRPLLTDAVCRSVLDLKPPTVLDESHA